MMNIKAKLTSPTAFSWYGVIGVVATGVLTFFSTKKWLEKDHSDDKPIQEKAKDALIFAPPVAAAVGASVCIIHGNNKAMHAVGDLISANTFLSRKIGNATSAALGAAATGLKTQQNVSAGHLYFSDDPEEVEDYGKAVLFYDDFTEDWFESTIFDVLLAEQEVHKFFNLRGYVTVGEFHEFMKLHAEEWMQRCGWDDDIAYKFGYNWVEFNHQRLRDDNGRVYYKIIYAAQPAFAKIFEDQYEDVWY